MCCRRWCVFAQQTQIFPRKRERESESVNCRVMNEGGGGHSRSRGHTHACLGRQDYGWAWAGTSHHILTWAEHENGGLGSDNQIAKWVCEQARV